LSAADALPPVDSVQGDLSGARILLVEDEPSTREGTLRLLETVGAQVQAVESAAAAREAYAMQRPSVIVSDIGLPGEDGYVLMQSIRSLERKEGARRVPALALTAFARKEDRARALAAGFDAHVVKPIDPDRLFRELLELLGRRKS
jgi:CheY-like chemotaxis protein